MHKDEDYNDKELSYTKVGIKNNSRNKFSISKHSLERKLPYMDVEQRYDKIDNPEILIEKNMAIRALLKKRVGRVGKCAKVHTHVERKARPKEVGRCSSDC